MINNREYKNFYGTITSKTIRNRTRFHQLNMENVQKTQSSHKRRSRIFQSRFTEFDQDKGKCITSGNQYQNFDLEEYMNYLKEERRNWQCLYKERKKQRRQFSKKKALIENCGQDLDPNLLSDLEKSFFSNAPDYNQIHTNFTNLLNMTVKIAVLSQLYCKVNKTFVLKMEEGIYNITRTVIETSKAQN